MKPTLNVFSPSADPRDALAYCEEAVRKERWFEKSGMREHWPLTTIEAAKMLSDGGEYDVDDGRLLDLIDRRVIDPPSEGEDGLEWDAQDLARACAKLEARGQWQPTPSGHDPKKHPTRIVLEQARASGELEAVAHGGPVRFDARHLLQLLVLCDQVEGRMKCAALLEAVLEVEHGVML